jgi:hypothetical protein
VQLLTHLKTLSVMRGLAASMCGDDDDDVACDQVLVVFWFDHCRERVFIALCKWVNLCSFCARAFIVACDECARNRGRSMHFCFVW